MGTVSSPGSHTSGEILTVNKAVSLGQKGCLQALPTAQWPTEQHLGGERGIASVTSLDVGQSWNKKI